jgi:hypothetical protein
MPRPDILSTNYVDVWISAKQSPSNGVIEILVGQPAQPGKLLENCLQRAVSWWGRRFRLPASLFRWGKLKGMRACAALCLALQLVAWGQETHPVTGRQIAPVMGMGGADWLVRPERESEEAPDAALDAIGIRKGSAAADIGAGAGYFTWRLAERVGPEGTVYGEDIQPGMIELLKKNIAARGLHNVKPVLGKPDDPKLPAEAVDLVLLVDVYHEFSEPEKMLRHIRRSLRADGRLVLLEYRQEDPKVPIRPEHKMSIQQVRAEIEPEGFHFENSLEPLPRQHILIFTKTRHN